MTPAASELYTAEQRSRDIILGKLAQIELDHEVEIILAVESGSRAWGFPSVDSDYDVRYVYRRKTEDYLRLVKKPETIGRSVKGALYDLAGWDVGKAMMLGLKSNAAFLEWLASPTRYRWSPLADELTACARRTVESKGLTYNYLNLARSFMEQAGPSKAVKKYFYGLRAALALRHLRMFPGPPPMNMVQLVKAVDLPKHLVSVVAEMVRIKAAGREMDDLPEAIPGLDLIRTLIQGEIDTALASKPEKAQLLSDEKLLELTEASYLRMIGASSGV